MITTLAVAGYRSLRDLAVPLGRLTLVTGGNGSGKTSLYRALRLLAETAQGRLVSTLATEGGIGSALWAGPETVGRDVRRGVHPVQGTVRRGPVSLRLGFSGEDIGYALDLGLPSRENPFPRDPAIKAEALWSGARYGRASVFAERRGAMVRLRSAETGAWRDAQAQLSPFDSMVTHGADPFDGAELLALRERLRLWRFYDALRTDPEAPARRPQVMTYTPVLAGDGSDLAAAVRTIRAIGDGEAFDEAVAQAFPGARVEVEGEGFGELAMRQHGLLRSLSAAELSDGTLRFLLLASALLSPRPPQLLVLNEPEASLHPSLMPPLARLLVDASRRAQIVVVSHSALLLGALREAGGTLEIRLEKRFGETLAPDAGPASFAWPGR